MIIAFEGVDGAGKNTLVSAVEAELISREIPVARVGFPRYEDSAPAQLAQQALYGEMGDLIDSVHGMATLFALDRHEVAQELANFDDDGYVVLLDRYSASNAAYSAARMGGIDSEKGREIVEWVENLERSTLDVPGADLQVLVDVDVRIAAERAQDRENEKPERERDTYEKNADLQQLTAEAYRHLAEHHWCGPWYVVNSNDGDVDGRARTIAAAIEELLAESAETDHIVSPDQVIPVDEDLNAQ